MYTYIRNVMFDKVIFNVRISPDIPVPFIVKRNHLLECTEGEEVYYQSSSYGNLEGVFLKIRNGRIQIKCSLHKLYSKWNGGTLDNSGPFTMLQAQATIYELFQRIGIETDEASITVTYFEIGLNIPVEHDVLDYISLVSSIGKENEKELFNDANFRKNRQKTTEKSSTIKKVFKIYDKGFEYRNKGKPVKGNILRIETMFRRQSIPLHTFIGSSFIKRITDRFYKDWSSISFPKRIESTHGVRATQMEKAQFIMEFGRDKYMAHIKNMYACGTYTKRQAEQARAFVREWDAIKHKFRYISDNKEVEYLRKLHKLLTKVTVS